jgi:MoaA/NifB/PqqE/SkfB family radical SAM enzyme
MLESVAGFHIEPTNICTLKCPRCSRTKFIEKFPSRWKNKQLNLDHLKSFIDIEIKNKIFILAGDYGDPIYYDNLFELVSWIKTNGATIRLHTNGSYKTKSWWQQLVSYLDCKDKIIFGIDGTPENFTQYRINADWPSIKTGIEVVAKQVQTTWQFIPFAYNIDSISIAEQLSKDLGVDEFLLLKSSRWDSLNDPYRPNDDFVVSNDREIKFVANIRAEEISPRCKKLHQDHFVTADGYYTPCCYAGNHNFYYKTEFYKNKEKYDISKTTFTQVLTLTQDYYDNLETLKPTYCLYHCPKL